MGSEFGIMVALGGAIIFLPLALLLCWGLSALMDRRAKKEDHIND